MLSPAAAPLAAPACPSSPVAAPFSLPHLRGAVAHGVPAVVVALGSSSTQGAMASDLAHSYPAILQQALGTDCQRRTSR